MLDRLWSRLLLGTTAFALTSAAAVGAMPSQAGTITDPWIDTENRDAVVVAYETEYHTEPPAMEWTGNYETCNPGDSSNSLALMTVRRVNFYRAMAGVPTGVTLNQDYSDKAQHAALAMSATGRLSHTPDDSFACLSEDGAEAAANSNLYLGRTGPRAIDGYIEDPGERNRDVGHRNTILHPPTTEIGVGHVAGSRTAYPANALWVFDDGVFDDSPPMREPDGFVAWPPRGYVPNELIYPRWSFGLADADFENAVVTMTSGDQEISLEVVARLSLQGYVPSPIIVWEPATDLGSVDIEADVGDVDPGTGEGETAGSGVLQTKPAYDTTVDVVVDGVVVDGTEVRFSYSVTILGTEGETPDADRTAFEFASQIAGWAARGVGVVLFGLY